MNSTVALRIFGRRVTHAGRARRVAGRPWFRRKAYGTVLCLTVLLSVSAPAESSVASIAERERVAGIDVIVYKTGLKDVVFLRGALPAGDIFNPRENPMLASLVVGMLDKGTRARDKFALAEQLGNLGATIAFGGGSHHIDFSAKCLAEDLPTVIQLLAEQLRAPAFTDEELSKYKQQRIAAIKRSLEDPGSRAGEAFSRAAYPEGHPNRDHTAEERLAGVARATVDDLKAFHSAHYGPGGMTLVAAGDVDRELLRTALTQAFAGWQGGRRLPQVEPVTGSATPARAEETVYVPGKTSVNVVWGQATGLRYRDADALPLRVATAILGSGFTGRLMANVRDKEGLTYGIGAGLGGDTFVDGDWTISATFAPALLDKGVASTRRQLASWHARGVTAEELNARKTNMIGAFQVSLATTSGIAGALLTTVQRGYELTWLDEYPKAINAVTLEQVNGAIKKYLDPAKMVLVKAGTVGAAQAGSPGNANR